MNALRIKLDQNGSVMEYNLVSAPNDIIRAFILTQKTGALVAFGYRGESSEA